MYQVALLSRPAPGWSGGCHTVQTFDTPEAIVERFGDDSTRQAIVDAAQAARQTRQAQRVDLPDRLVLEVVA